MNNFRRIFKYIWPQWPRIIVVILSAVVVSVLLSLSFMAVIPLLKVMMGEEGLNGWANRKTCEWRYGVQIYLPEKEDFAVSDFAHFLRITTVKNKGQANKAGVKNFDEIVGVGGSIVKADGDGMPSATLLETLAKAPAESEITIQLRRNKELSYLKMETGKKTFYLDSIIKVSSLLPKETGKSDKTREVVFIMLAMVLVTIIRCIAKFYQGYLAEKVVQIGINRLREDAYSHVLNMPMRFFANERPSDTVSRLIGDTAAMGKGIKILLGKALREPLNVVCFIGLALWLNRQLTLIFLCAGPVTLWLVVIFGKKTRRASKKSLMAGSQMLAKLQETMSGLKVVKVYNQQEYEQTLFAAINAKLLKQLLKISKVDAVTMPVLEVLGMIAGSAAIIAGIQWVQSEQIDASKFFAMLFLLGSSADAARKTSDVWNKIQEADAASERVFAVMDRPIETEKPGAIELPTLKNKIEFRNVTFTYPGNTKPSIRNVNLKVLKGHNVAIVGPNGSGKTTLANLLPRFYDPDDGSILVDGIDIRDATLFSLRNQIAMVTQDIVTFNDTITANIAYGRPGTGKEEIIDAAKRAFADEFIAPLPNGYDTIIGEHSTGLSGGQLQRIIIARAILKNPAILVFDEATSQVDADSEAKIRDAIGKIMQDRTSFIIAHRFSTIVNADVIVVMDDGRIIAQGRHDELIQTCPLYQSLYETQLVKE